MSTNTKTSQPLPYSTANTQEQQEQEGDLFVQVSFVFLRSPDFSPIEKIVYQLLLSYGDFDQLEKGIVPSNVMPGHKKLAKEAGVEERTIERALNSLKAKGMVTWERRGFTKTNIYYLKLFQLKHPKKEDSLASEPAKMSVQEPAKMSVQEPAKMSVQEPAKMSDKQDPVEKDPVKRESATTYKGTKAKSSTVDHEKVDVVVPIAPDLEKGSKTNLLDQGALGPTPPVAATPPPKESSSTSGLAGPALPGYELLREIDIAERKAIELCNLVAKNHPDHEEEYIKAVITKAMKEATKNLIGLVITLIEADANVNITLTLAKSRVENNASEYVTNKYLQYEEERIKRINRMFEQRARVDT